MNGLPVTVRLLDPPLHEFLPKTEKDPNEIFDDLDIDKKGSINKEQLVAY